MFTESDGIVCMLVLRGGGKNVFKIELLFKKYLHFAAILAHCKLDF